MRSHPELPYDRTASPINLAGTPPRPPFLERHWQAILLGLAFVIGVPTRLMSGYGLPLWFDETFSAVIATQPNLGSLLRWCLNELTGPAYYVPLWIWVKAFGASDVALRAASMACSLAAPLVILRYGSADRLLRVFWCAIVLLWLPALIFANDARSYAQLFLLGSVQAIAFLHLIRGPCTRRALSWTCVSVLMVLTHYYAIPIVGSQGVLYLLLGRQRAIKTWPAFLPVLLLLGWMAVHLPFVFGLSAACAASCYAPTPNLLPLIPLLMFGTGLQGSLLLAIIGLSTVVLLAKVPPKRGSIRTMGLAPEWALVLSGALAFGLVLVFATVRPGFAPRYLAPCHPALLFAVAWWMRWSIDRSAIPVLALFAAMAGGMLQETRAALTDTALDHRHLFNLEQPSAWLLQRHPDRLVFAFADPVGVASSATPLGRANVGEVGGFFLRRAGQAVDVVVAGRAHAPPSSSEVLSLAGTDPRSAILWIGNDFSSPSHIVPTLAEGSWECRDFGKPMATVVACRRKR